MLSTAWLIANSHLISHAGNIMISFLGKVLFRISRTLLSKFGLEEIISLLLLMNLMALGEELGLSHLKMIFLRAWKTHT
jgi:hypothetical protein